MQFIIILILSYLIYLHLEAYYIIYTYTRNVFLGRCKKGYGTIEDITRNPWSKVGEVGNGERKGKKGVEGLHV